MKQYSHKGDVMEYTAPGGGVTKDVPVLISGLLVIPTVTVAATVKFNAVVAGVVSGLAKTTGEAWAEGEKLYWVTGTSKFSTTAGGNQLVGTAAAAAGSADTTGDVRLDGVAR